MHNFCITAAWKWGKNSGMRTTILARAPKGHGYPMNMGFLPHDANLEGLG